MEEEEMSEASKIIDGYGDLVKHALRIVTGAPYFMYYWDEKFLRLSIVDDTATLSWPEIESDYEDMSYIELKHIKFPAALFTMSEADLLSWKESERIKYRDAAAEKVRQDRQDYEAKERALLAALQAKYPA
jgi:hypothetical protein